MSTEVSAPPTQDAPPQSPEKPTYPEVEPIPPPVSSTVKYEVTPVPLTHTVVLLVFLCLFCPPLAVYLSAGAGKELSLNVALTLLGFVPGIIHALVICFRHEPQVVYQRDTVSEPASSELAARQTVILASITEAEEAAQTAPSTRRSTLQSAVSSTPLLDRASEPPTPVREKPTRRASSLANHIKKREQERRDREDLKAVTEAHQGGKGWQSQDGDASGELQVGSL